MKDPNTPDIPNREKSVNGNGDEPHWRPHPDFSTYSDDRLNLAQSLLDEEIRGTQKAGNDPLLVVYFEQEMRLLQAERSRRNIVSSPKENKPCAINFPLQSWADFLSTDFADQPFTIEGIAPEAGLIAVHGRGKDGKTTLLIHGCRAIASGQPFLNKATTKKPVVYLNYEMGFAYLQKLLNSGGPCPDDAYILNRPEPVLQMATIETLMAGINRPGVMVIDSFRGAFRLHGDAENSAGGAGVILRNIQDIAIKHKWVVIVIHHRNRSAREGTDGISGTSDWIAAPDVIWTWSKSDKAKPGTLSVDGRMPPVEPMAVQLTPEECVLIGSVEESRDKTDKAAIVAVLTDEGQTAVDIADAIKIPVSSVRKRLESLYEADLVKRDGEGKRGSPFLYSKINCAQPIPLGAETKLTRAALDAFPGSKLGGPG